MLDWYAVEIPRLCLALKGKRASMGTQQQQQVGASSFKDEVMHLKKEEEVWCRTLPFKGRKRRPADWWGGGAAEIITGWRMKGEGGRPQLCQMEVFLYSEKHGNCSWHKLVGYELQKEHPTHPIMIVAVRFRYRCWAAHSGEMTPLSCHACGGVGSDKEDKRL